MIPTSPEVHYQLANVLRRMKEPRRAEEELQKFKALEEESKGKVRAASYRVNGTDLLDSGKPKEAAAAYREALKLDPGNSKLHYDFSVALARLGDHTAQLQELEKAIELDPNLPQAHHDLGLLFLMQDRKAEAEKAFENALAADPGFTLAKDALGRLKNAGLTNR